MVKSDLELQDQELKDHELQDQELQDHELQNHRLQDQELQDHELQDHRLQNHGLQDHICFVMRFTESCSVSLKHLQFERPVPEHNNGHHQGLHHHFMSLVTHPSTFGDRWYRVEVIELKISGSPCTCEQSSCTNSVTHAFHPVPSPEK